LPIFKKPIYITLIFIAVAMIYGEFLHNPVVFDDLQFFIFKQSLHHFQEFHPLEIRWLPYFTIAKTAQVLGLELIWFRLEGLLLHAMVGIALFLFLDRLFGVVLEQEEKSSTAIPGVWMAFFGALIFVWHPVAVYGAAYLIQRTIVMSTLFSLLALYAYMRGLVEERPLWLWSSVVLYCLAVFSKEHAVMLPAVMLALTLLLAQPSKALFWRLLPIYVACTLIALYMAMQKLGILGSVYEVSAPEMLEKINIKHPYPLSVLTQSFLFFKYLFLWLVPNPEWMSVDMREAFAGSILSPYLLAFIGFVAYGALALKLLLKRGRLGLVGFGMIFPWLLFATEFATVRIQESFVLYRSYLWMPGIFAAMPFFFSKVQGKVVFTGLFILALVFAMLAVNRLTTFSNLFLLWDDAEKLVHDKQHLPGVYRIYYNRGKSLTDMRRYRKALADYQRAALLAPDDVANRYALGVGYMNVAQYAKAVVEFNKTIKMQPNHYQAMLGRGLSYLELGNKVAALPDLEVSCKTGFKIACTKIKAMDMKNQPPG
jgi:protein O-mannosyl-transferase